MTTMVERVARALCDDTLKRWRTPIAMKREPWKEFIPAARAAIEAMRDANLSYPLAKPMFEGDEISGRHTFSGDSGAWLSLWNASIDAALKEGGE